MPEEEDKIYEMHANLCKMIAHPTRLKILDLLRDGEKTVTELIDGTGESQPTISHHLSELRKRNIVESTREGQNIFYEVSHEKVLKACDLIHEVLLERMNRLQELQK
ncbi:MAG: ArsR/SmtB family transcription factor [Candidatus Aenigmatarchaeota archaeon]